MIYKNGKVIKVVSKRFNLGKFSYYHQSKPTQKPCKKVIFVFQKKLRKLKRFVQVVQLTIYGTAFSAARLQRRRATWIECSRNFK